MKKDNIKFSWDIHWACDYRCPYCWWHGKWDEFKQRNVYPGKSKLIDTWKRMYEKYGQIHLEIAGGEPFLYPDFFEILDELLGIHTACIMTNFSFEVEKLLSISMEKLERLQIGATFHPLFADFNNFLKKAVEIKKRELAIEVLCLAYPPQIKKIPFLKNELKKRGIKFAVPTFWGRYKGKEYPASYTKEELRIISTAIGQRHGEDFQTNDPKKTKGISCNAGHKYGVIHPDGEVLPCGGASWRGENIVMGNIFDKNFKLWDEPKVCWSDYCPCNEWSFLLKDGRTG